MSWEAREWAKTWGVGELASSNRFVLLMLCDHSNPRVRRAWPSVSTLSNETGLDRRTVLRKLDALAADHIIEIERWFDPLGSKLRNRYALPWFDSRSTSVGRVVAIEQIGEHGRWLVDVRFPDDEALCRSWGQLNVSPVL